MRFAGDHVRPPISPIAPVAPISPMVDKVSTPKSNTPIRAIPKSLAEVGQTGGKEGLGVRVGTGTGDGDGAGDGAGKRSVLPVHVSSATKPSLSVKPDREALLVYIYTYIYIDIPLFNSLSHSFIDIIICIDVLCFFIIYCINKVCVYLATKYELFFNYPSIIALSIDHINILTL